MASLSKKVTRGIFPKMATTWLRIPFKFFWKLNFQRWLPANFKRWHLKFPRKKCTSCPRYFMSQYCELLNDTSMFVKSVIIFSHNTGTPDMFQYSPILGCYTFFLLVTNRRGGSHCCLFVCFSPKWLLCHIYIAYLLQSTRLKCLSANKRSNVSHKWITLFVLIAAHAPLSAHPSYFEVIP